MSIKVGFPNDRYTKAFAEQHGDETLSINSYKTSDTIQLNKDSMSFSNVFLSLKNFKTGVDDNGYSIYKDDLCLATFNSNIVRTFQNAEFQGNFAIQDIVSIQSNINTNITFNIETEGDVFNINDKNGSLFQVNTSEISVARDFKMNDGILYVKNISGFDGNTIQLNNVQYSDATLDSLVANQSLSVEDQTMVYIGDDIAEGNKACLQVIKINNNRDYFKLISTKGSDLPKNIFNINSFGNINIGNEEGNQESTINISHVSKNIINYNGNKTGDVFQISENADIGIGINNPDAQLHIKRNDGENIIDGSFYRNNTMLHLDMDYNEINNISNIFVERSGAFDKDTIPEYSILEKQGTYEIYLVNSEILTNPINDRKEDIFIDKQVLNVAKSSYSIPMNVDDIENFESFISDNIPNISLIYPESTNQGIMLSFTPGLDESLLYEVLFEIGGVNGMERSITIPYIINLNDNIPGQTESNYVTEQIKLFETQFVTPEGASLKCIYFLNLTIQSYVGPNPSWEYRYKTIETTVLPPPNFFKLEFNDTFVSSISANGTLSLGSEVPEEKQEYLIYAPGKSHIETLNVSNFITDNSQKIMNFNHANLLNINSIETQNMSINSLSVDNINSTNTDFQNVNTNDLKFEIISSTYLQYRDLFTKIKNKLILGDSDDTTNNSLIEINVMSSITNVTNAYGMTRRNGLIVKNIDYVSNPCLDIKGVQSTPFMTLTNISTTPASSTTNEITTTKSSYMRYVKNDNKLYFQLFSDYKNDNFATSDNPLCAINYCTDDNILAIGGNAICVKYNNNDSYRITLGVPDVIGSDDNTTEENYLHHNLLNSSSPTDDVNVAIYGVLKVASEKQVEILKTNADGKLILSKNIQMCDIDPQTNKLTGGTTLVDFIISIMNVELNRLGII